MFSQHKINRCSWTKLCKPSNCFVIIFIADSVSSSSGCNRCLYSTNNVFYRDIAAITTLWPVECFLWSMGVHELDIYITLLHINFVHQTDPLQGIVHARDVRQWCNVANINSSWNFEVIDIDKWVILSAQFVSNLWCGLGNEMMTASYTGYGLTIFEPLLHLLSHLNQVFFVNAKEDNGFHFFLAYFQHYTIVQNLVVEWSLQTLFCNCGILLYHQFHHTVILYVSTTLSNFCLALVAWLCCGTPCRFSGDTPTVSKVILRCFLGLVSHTLHTLHHPKRPHQCHPLESPPLESPPPLCLRNKHWWCFHKQLCIDDKVCDLVEHWNFLL